MFWAIIPRQRNENFSNSESDQYETISYAVVCNDLSEVIKGEKLPLEIKRAVQVEITQQALDSEKISAHSKMMDVLSRVTPSMMKEAQEEDADISKTISQDLCEGICSSLIDWYFAKEYCTQFMSKMGPNTTNSFRPQTMELLDNQQGHQAGEHTLQLVHGRFYWSTLLQDITSWVKNCKQCQTARDPYIESRSITGINYC